MVCWRATIPNRSRSHISHIDTQPDASENYDSKQDSTGLFQSLVLQLDNLVVCICHVFWGELPNFETTTFFNKNTTSNFQQLLYLWVFGDCSTSIGVDTSLPRCLGKTMKTNMATGRDNEEIYCKVYNYILVWKRSVYFSNYVMLSILYMHIYSLFIVVEILENNSRMFHSCYLWRCLKLPGSTSIVWSCCISAKQAIENSRRKNIWTSKKETQTSWDLASPKKDPMSRKTSVVFEKECMSWNWLLTQQQPIECTMQQNSRIQAYAISSHSCKTRYLIITYQSL